MSQELTARLTELGINIPNSCLDDKKGCLLKERVVCFEVDDKHNTVKPLHHIIKSAAAVTGQIYIVLCTEATVKTKNKPLLLSLLSENGDAVNNVIPFAFLDNTISYYNDVIMNTNFSQETRIWFKPYKSENDKSILDKLKPELPKGRSLNDYIVKDVTNSFDGKVVYVPVLSNLGKYISIKPGSIQPGKCTKVEATETSPERFELEKSYYEAIKPEFLSVLTPNHLAYTNLKNFTITATVPKSTSSDSEKDKEKDKFYASFRIYIFYM
jgi:hypothetical protein